MTTTSDPIDSVRHSSDATIAGQYPAVPYPLHTDQYLRDFLDYLLGVVEDDPAPVMPSLTEPSLYVLAAALARHGPIHRPTADWTIPLLREIRWRNCRAMGSNPTGRVRRGRLIQLIGSLTPLAVAGASPLQRDKLAGRCPFCRDGSLRVFLRAVRWRCFGCDRNGGLLEFAEYLLETIPQ